MLETRWIEDTDNECLLQLLFPKFLLIKGSQFYLEEEAEEKITLKSVDYM